MRVHLSALAEADLYDIALYISRDSLAQAERLLAKFDGKFGTIGKNPRICRVREELGLDLRLATVGRYLIIFRVTTDSVEVKRIVPGERDLTALWIDADD